MTSIHMHQTYKWVLCVIDTYIKLHINSLKGVTTDAMEHIYPLAVWWAVQIFLIFCIYFADNNPLGIFYIFENHNLHKSIVEDYETVIWIF